MVIGNAPEYSTEIVEEAIRESLAGTHGEFLQEVCRALLKELADAAP